MPYHFQSDLSSFSKIQSDYRAGIPPTKIGYCLLIKYMKITRNTVPQDKQKSWKALFFRLPILYLALISGKPDLELVRFLAKSNPNVVKPIKCVSGLKYTRGRFEEGYHIDIDPMTDAIEGKQSLEVIRILISEFKDHINLSERLVEAVIRQNLELVKEFGNNFDEKTEFFVNHASYPSPMYHAIRLGNVEILKYLVSRNKGKYKTREAYSATPLHDIVHYCGNDSLRIHQCIEMANLVLPKIENINACNVQGQTLFDEIIKNFEYTGRKKCIIDI